MEIFFAGAQLAKTCNDNSTRQKRLGAERAKKVLLRLNQMRGADNLAELAKLPQARCHQLTGDRPEQFSLDLDGPYRLICEVADSPIPRLPDGGIDRTQVRSLRILEIADPHTK